MVGQRREMNEDEDSGKEKKTIPDECSSGTSPRRQSVLNNIVDDEVETFDSEGKLANQVDDVDDKKSEKSTGSPADFVLTIDDEVKIGHDDYSANINLNMNNLDLKTNVRKFAEDANGEDAERRGRVLSSSSVEDNSKTAPLSLTECHEDDIDSFTHRYCIYYY